MSEQQVKLWNKDFVLIIIINFLVFMNHLMIISTFPFYIEYLGGSEAVAGMAAALFSIIAVVCRPLIGWMLDNGRRKVILIIGLCGMLLMPLGYLVSAILFLAFVCRMVHGAALACSNTSTSTIATDIILKPRFAEGMGMFGLATALAPACAPALGLSIMESMGFTTLFVFAAISVAIALVLFMLLKTPKIEVEKKPLNIKGLLDKDALPASATALVFMLTYGALENFTAKFAAEENLPGGGIFFAIMAVAIAPPERRGSANSTFLCAYDIGIGVGGGIAGTLISSFGYHQMFAMMTVFNVLSIVIYVLFGKNHPSSFTYRKEHGME